MYKTNLIMILTLFTDYSEKEILGLTRKRFLLKKTYSKMYTIG